MRARNPKKTGQAEIEVDVNHWAGTVVSYDDYLYGFPLMNLLPDVALGHGIRLKVTVELISPGKRCDVRHSRDGNKCPQDKK